MQVSNNPCGCTSFNCIQNDISSSFINTSVSGCFFKDVSSVPVMNVSGGYDISCGFPYSALPNSSQLMKRVHDIKNALSVEDTLACGKIIYTLEQGLLQNKGVVSFNIPTNEKIRRHLASLGYTIFPGLGDDGLAKMFIRIN